MHIGDVLRTVRTKASVSQETLALVTGITNSYISLIESGDRQPSTDVLGRLFEALGVPLWYAYYLLDYSGPHWGENAELFTAILALIPQADTHTRQLRAKYIRRHYRRPKKRLRKQPVRQLALEME